jgi:hypothetical protein
MLNGLSIPVRVPPKRQMTEETIPMKAIVVTDQAVGRAAMKLVERPEPQAAINDMVVQAHASRFAPAERAWPSTWIDHLNRDRTASIPGYELAMHEAAVIGNSHGASSGAARLCQDVVHA